MEERRTALLGFLTIVITVVICAVFAEIALRFLPVSTGIRTVAVTAESPVFHFLPNRDFLYSRDWDMVMANRGHVNNAGFVNDQDYRKDDPLPLIGVIGDSMIEAAMVPYRDTLQGRLAAALHGKAWVYSFATSGAPLSQYLIWARHAVEEYGAQALLINVVGNDFDESHASYKTQAGFWHYVPDGENRLHLRLFEYQPSSLSNLVYASALGRYLNFNLRVGAYWRELRGLMFGGPAMANPQYAGNTTADANPTRVRDSLAAIDAFFHDFPDLVRLPRDRVAFTVDGFRYPGAAQAGAGTYFDLMRRAFLAKAGELGYEVVDLEPKFFARHRKTGELFEFPIDAHWSSIGHDVAFEAVMSSRIVGQLIQ